VELNASTAGEIEISSNILDVELNASTAG